MGECSNDIPFPRIRLTRAGYEQYGNNRHQQISLDQPNPDHWVALHETEWASSSLPADGRGDSAPQRNQRQDRSVDPQQPAPKRGNARSRSGRRQLSFQSPESR